jgi:hypothetical protein
MDRDCASVLVLETLDRQPTTLSERAQQLESRIAEIQQLFGMQRDVELMPRRLVVAIARGELTQEAAVDLLTMMRAAFEHLVSMTLGPGQRLSPQHLARAHCQLSRLRWEMITLVRHGAVPGRLLRPRIG